MALVAGVGTVAAFFVFGGFGGGSGSGVDPDAAMPSDAFLFASANVAELRRSPLWEVLFSGRADTSVLDKRTLGLEKLGDACGFDPLTRVEKLAVSVPESGERGDLSVAARVTVTAPELEKCTGALTTNAGASATQNGFSVITTQGGSRVGYGHDLLVAGAGKWFDRMLATADGKNPNVKASAQHVAIRSYLTSQNGWGAPSMVVTAVLPATIRDRIRNEIAGEPGDKTAAQAAMGGVLGVSGVGLALKAGGKGGSIELAAELVCDTDVACGNVEKLVSRQRFEWSKELMLRMVGLGPLLDSIVIKHDGTKVLVTAAAPAEQLAATLDRVMRFRGGRHEAPPAPPPAPVKPDEQIAAPRPSP